jgi:hypothetical protein
VMTVLCQSLTGYLLFRSCSSTTVYIQCDLHYLACQTDHPHAANNAHACVQC